jgi:hypothetical protein
MRVVTIDPVVIQRELVVRAKVKLPEELPQHPVF